MNISKIDKNFSNQFTLEGMKSFTVNEAPFALYGLCRETGELDFKRLPHAFADQCGSTAVKALYANTSGIRVRFRTDSKRIVLKCQLPGVTKFPHMPLTGTSCFDLYADGDYCSVFQPGIDIGGGHGENPMREDGYASGYVFRERKLRDILIHFPLYNDVEQVWIAVEEDAVILPSEPYSRRKPMVLYGSSITQGACASHPGNSYAAMLSRRFDIDFLNLGFSGGALGEESIADYIAGLDMGIFVLDYDHNAPTAEHLEQTHAKFFSRIRRSHPELPTILVSAADRFFPDYPERRKIIRDTCENAKAAGDRNVYFVDGVKIYGQAGREYCRVDYCHPNDLGFWCMAQAIGQVVETVLRREESMQRDQ